MAAPSTEQRENDLVEKVDYKILAVANDEEKLQSLLRLYLAPLILKAASEHASVREKVTKIIVSLNNFIRPPSIVLPVKALLEQYKSNASPVVKQLDLHFIQHSLDRLDLDDRAALIPMAINGLAADKDHARASSVLNITLRLLLDAPIPSRGSKDDEAFRASVGLSNHADAEFLARALGVLFRLRPPIGSQALAESNPALSPSELQLFTTGDAGSDKIFRRLTELKVKMISFMASAAFTDDERFLPALYAAAGPDSKVASTAEEILKRSSVSLEDEALIKQLFDIYTVSPAAYRTRILSVLSRSAISTTMTDQLAALVQLDFAPQPSHGSSAGPSLMPASALERNKLHKALFQYLSWVARIGSSQKGFAVGSRLIRSMAAYIETQGWPAPPSLTIDEVNLRSKAYEIIGMLVKGANMTVTERIDLGAWLFRSLSEDPTKDAVVNIDGALSSLMASIPSDVEPSQDSLRALLLEYMLLPDGAPAVRSTRHAVVKGANQCLPYTDVCARWIDILAIAGRSDERNDVVEGGLNGLNPATYSTSDTSRPPLPDWKRLVSVVFSSIIEPSAPPSGTSIIAAPSDITLTNFVGREHAMPIVLSYCKEMMWLEALDDLLIDANWRDALKDQVSTRLECQEKIRSYLKTVDQAHMELYLRSCFEGRLLNDTAILEECLGLFVGVASMCPGEVLAHLMPLSSGIRGLIESPNHQVQSLAAQALSILAAHPASSSDIVLHQTTDLMRLVESSLPIRDSPAKDTDSNKVSAAFLAVGTIQSRAVYYGFDVPGTEYPFRLLFDEKQLPATASEVLVSFTKLWYNGLALPDANGDFPISRVIEILAKAAKTGQEVAVKALGGLACGLDDVQGTATEIVGEGGDGAICGGPLGVILNKLLALHEENKIEIMLAMGSALAAAVARWDSHVPTLELGVEAHSPHPRLGVRAALLEAVLEKLVQDSKATKPSLLKSSGTSLLSFVFYCSHLSQVQTRLREIQAAFMRLLSARDKFVQETASRGLSLVYERGDADVKSALVKDLVNAFTGSGTKIKVAEETELFEPGALPTGEGNSVTSYKDIVNLANEVGDQSLVYKFMSLAANAATWTTRSAFGNLGLSNILAESTVEPIVYAKLYRYRFDPNPNVQRSMGDIWKALVKDSNAVLMEHFDLIMGDLLKSILDREWRVRQASCMALSDAIQGRPFPQYAKYYKDVWIVALKVLDDVKGSVRESASRLCKTLSTSLVRQLEEGRHAAVVHDVMGEVLPFLLSEKDMGSSVQEVQGFAAFTVLKISKHGGKMLRPFTSDLVTQLLGLLSTIEPQQINYHYQRVGEENRDEIDRLRSQMVNRSPISEAIEDCLRFADAEIIANLGPPLEASIKSAIGMPTKIGCSRVLTTLATQHASDFAPVAGRFMRLLEKQVVDRNDEVSQAYAKAAAYVVRTVPDAAQTRYCERCIDMYMQAEEESHRQKVAHAVAAIAKVSSDQFGAHEGKLVPLSYLGTHDVDEYTGKVFGEVWNKHAGSSGRVVRFLSEIAALIEQCLDTAQWALRHTGAFAAASMAEDVAKNSEVTGGMSETTSRRVWSLLDKATALKTFPGKEKLLEAFPKLVEQGQALWQSDEQVAAQMKKVMLREAKRNNDDYRIHAFRCLWRFAKARNDLDMLQDITQLTQPHLDAQRDENKMDLDGKEASQKEEVILKTAKSALEAVARGYSRSPSKDFRASLRDLVVFLQPYLSSARFDMIKREIWYECVRDMMTEGVKLVKTAQGTPSQTVDGSGSLMWLLESLDLDRAEAGTEAQRLRRAQAFSAVLQAKMDGVFGNAELAEGWLEKVRRARGEERALGVSERGRRSVIKPSYCSCSYCRVARAGGRIESARAPETARSIIRPFA